MLNHSAALYHPRVNNNQSFSEAHQGRVLKPQSTPMIMNIKNQRQTREQSKVNPILKTIREFFFFFLDRQKKKKKKKKSGKGFIKTEL